MDGTPTLRLNEFMLASLAANKIDLGPARDENTGLTLASPQEIKFELDDKCKEAIKGSEQRFDELVGKHDLHVSSVNSLIDGPLLMPVGRYYTTRGTGKLQSRSLKFRQTHGPRP